MQAVHSGDRSKHKRHLVLETTAKLREMILECEPETQIGSLKELAQRIGVGIVTVQQAARVLEHEGLLAVRRGPGGGYYGKRPDEAALERSLAAFLRVHGIGSRDTQEMISLLDCEIIPAAARCEDASLRNAILALSKRVDACDTAEQRVAFEGELRNLMFRFVAQPLLEFLFRVTSQLRTQEAERGPIFVGAEGVAAWKTGRRRILQAILSQDEELALFEAVRYRQDLLRRLRARESGIG